MSTQLCWITRQRFMCTWREHKLHNASTHTHTHRMRARLGGRRGPELGNCQNCRHNSRVASNRNNNNNSSAKQSISVVIQLKQMLKMQITQWFTFRLTYFRRTVCSIQSSTHSSSVSLPLSLSHPSLFSLLTLALPMHLHPLLVVPCPATLVVIQKYSQAAQQSPNWCQWCVCVWKGVRRGFHRATDE